MERGERPPRRGLIRFDTGDGWRRRRSGFAPRIDRFGTGALVGAAATLSAIAGMHQLDRDMISGLAEVERFRELCRVLELDPEPIIERARIRSLEGPRFLDALAAERRELMEGKRS